MDSFDDMQNFREIKPKNWITGVKFMGAMQTAD
jgi:hypothetical protein